MRRPLPRIGRVLAVDGLTVRVWSDGHVRTVAAPAPSTPPTPSLEPGDLCTLRSIDVDGDEAVWLARPQRDDVFAPDGDLSRMLANQGRRDAALRDRAALLTAIRAFFRRRDFLEVQTPALALCPGLEVHLDAIAVDVREGMGGAMVRRHLVTSPEFHCKRLLHAGLTRIYALASAFRSGERGGHHNPEFTMLEWYRAGQDSEAIIADVGELIRRCAAAITVDRKRRGEARIVWRPRRALRLSFGTALQRFAGLRVSGTDEASEAGAACDSDIDGPPAPVPTLRARAERIGVATRDTDSAADVLLAVFADRVEPALAAYELVIVDRWPICLASLARPLAHAPWLAERFEIYLRGVEIANGFGELVDGDEQRRRFESDLRQRRERSMPCYPIDERFLQALGRGCPPAGGVALGVDRLLMALGGYDSIDDVVAFPFERA